MPETPDFDQIALQLAVNHGHQGSIGSTAELAVSASQTQQLAIALAEQLRLTWNARGAADQEEISADWLRGVAADITPTRAARRLGHDGGGADDRRLH